MKVQVLNKTFNVEYLSDTQLLWIAMLELHGHHAFNIMKNLGIELDDIILGLKERADKYFSSKKYEQEVGK